MDSVAAINGSATLTRRTVSIGLPVYNGQQYLAEAIESILSQTYEDFDLIISDNGSSDLTPQICQQYARSDRRIKFYRHETNRGASWNFNFVVDKAGGKYFKWVAHDDVHKPQFLRRCVDVLEADPAIVLCFTDEGGIDDQGRYLGPRPYPLPDLPTPQARLAALFLQSRGSPPVFGLIRTHVLQQTPRIDYYDAADLVLLAELTLRGRLHKIGEELLLHREHPQRSVYVCRDPYSATLWFAPSRKGRIVFPAWRRLRGYLSAIRRTPLTVSQRVACCVEIARWVRYHNRLMFRDIKVAAGSVARALTRQEQPNPAKTNT
jgi:glycosyltransferase involved in cell wall biosynthesis